MMSELEIKPAEAEPFPLCGTDCQQLGYDRARDQYFCKVADEWLPGCDVVCVPFIQRKIERLLEFEKNCYMKYREQKERIEELETAYDKLLKDGWVEWKRAGRPGDWKKEEA
jgi:hypothetical protein